MSLIRLQENALKNLGNAALKKKSCLTLTKRIECQGSFFLLAEFTNFSNFHVSGGIPACRSTARRQVC